MNAPKGTLRRILKPPPSVLNVAARRNYRHLRELLMAGRSTPPKVLLVGGGDRKGVGTEEIGGDVLGAAVNLELQSGKGVDVRGDGHFLPFAGGRFDAVVAQAVLEHVADPQIVLDEVHRVLRGGGYIYVEVPFLQCYHPAPTDFQRYTLDGLHRLLSSFRMLDSGVCVGPGSMMSDMTKYFLALILSGGNDRLFQLLFRGLGWLTFPLKYLDLILSGNENARYMASGFYYLGMKA